MTDWMYDRFHKSRYLAQNDGPKGPGSCYCCPNGGPFAGKLAPKKIKPNAESRLKAREIKDPELQELAAK